MYRVRKTWGDPASQLGAYDIYKNAFIMANNNPGYSIYDEAGIAVYTAAQKVQTMSYKAKLLRKVGSHAKGAKVTVTRDLDKRWVMADGTIVKEKSYMDLLTQIYEADCKYTKETAEGFTARLPHRAIWTRSDIASGSLTAYTGSINRYLQG